MIQSYNEEVKTRRNKAAIFWFFVFLLSGFLYLFFQGYYLNIDFRQYVNNPNVKSVTLKQFGIVNMQFVPTPEKILINGTTYTNGNKSIFYYGDYSVESTASGYIPIQFNIEINKNFPIFYETINQFKKFKYTAIKESFDTIEKVDDYYLAFSNTGKVVNVYNQNLKIINSFVNDYQYVGYKYFSDNGYLYIYDSELNILKPYISKETKLGIFCRNPRIYHDRLFCYDNMDFIDGSEMKGDEEVLRINNNLILTHTYIYNNGNGGDWGTYELPAKYLYDPENVVHIDKMPYILEDGLLYEIQSQKKNQFKLDNIDTIKNSFEFGNETVFVGFKGSELVFSISDEKKKYGGKLDKTDPKKINIIKLNGAYFINTGTRIYLYYKGSDKLISILKGEDIKIIDKTAFFKKNSKNYYMNLLEE